MRTAFLAKTISERLEILKKTKKIIFISEWVKSRFFSNIDSKLSTNTEVIYHSVNKQLPVKKNKFITYVGKLNHAKGYDIYSEAIVKILDEFPKWKALSIGDEERSSIYINHKNHYELGFLNH